MNTFFTFYLSQHITNRSWRILFFDGVPGPSLINFAEHPTLHQGRVQVLFIVLASVQPNAIFWNEDYTKDAVQIFTFTDVFQVSSVQKQIAMRLVNGVQYCP